MSARVAPGRLVAALIVIAGCWVVLGTSLMPVGLGIKGDEATYVSMALSAAYDGDLTFETRDLERFRERYGTGPEGIFLKRGKRIEASIDASWPFLHVSRPPYERTDRLYFGKAFVYPVAAAPFVRLAGLRGLFLFHVLLMAAVFLGAYHFIAARSPVSTATLYSLAFLGVSITPVYIFWLTPEIFNFALVFFAFFLWLYKEVAPPKSGAWARLLRSRWSDLLAAALLGLATYSKPLNVPLIGPLVLLSLWRRLVVRAVLIAIVFSGVVTVSFGMTAFVTGELNYQGGDRKTFYGRFPFESPDADFETRGIRKATDDLQPDVVPDVPVRIQRFRDNLFYFLLGRHSGLIPYYFPGFVAVILCLRSRSGLRVWQVLTLGAVFGIALTLLLWLPHTWAGGGGPPGNRYFLTLYPALLFVTPPLASLWPAVVSCVGGALFMSQILIHPLISSSRPWYYSNRGLLRHLPVEMTMANDLPVMVHIAHGRVPYGHNPTLLLYFLDDHAWLPEPSGIWVAGRARTEIIVRTGQPLSRLDVQLKTLVSNTVRLGCGGPSKTVTIEPRELVTVSLVPEGSYSERGIGYLLSVETTAGIEPSALIPGYTDGRFLGVLMRLSGTLAGPAAEK